jgi:membrane-associated protein
LQWLDAQYLVEAFGGFAVLAVAALIFFETAFILTSFFPGDSLLFILGLTLAEAAAPLPFPLALLLVLATAIAGTQVGFEVGKKLGPTLFERRGGWIFNHKVVSKSHELFERYGARAVILARFVPILRALVPMLAGISYLERDKFVKYNLVGGAIWVLGFMNAGYWFGQLPWVQHNLELAVLIVVVATSLPMPIEILRAWLRQRSRNQKPE